MVDRDSERFQEKKKKTESLLAGIKNLPSVPKVMNEVSKMLQDEHVTSIELTKVIAKDQGLTTKLLTVANSPLYGLQRRVASLEFAIMVLGFEEIGNIVTALSLSEAIKIESSPDFNYNNFWMHSILVGSAAKEIARKLGYMDFATDAFVAGILHEMGISLIYKYLTSDFHKITRTTKSNGVSYLDAEYETLGTSHQEIGKFLAEKWNLPPILCNTIEYHHIPSKSQENKSLISIIHLADYMTQKLNIGAFYWDEGMELDMNIISLLDLENENKLETFINDFKDIFTETAEAIKI